MAADKHIIKMGHLPQPAQQAVQQLQKVAFDGLVEDKIVFTMNDLPDMCMDDPTYYGLLQSVECYCSDKIGTSTKSFNFLHLGIQEYFAAKHVATLPDDEVYTLLKESFLVIKTRIKAWDRFSHDPDLISKSIRLSNTWIIYCITSRQSSSLRLYLSPPIKRILSPFRKYKIPAHIPSSLFVMCSDDEASNTSDDENTTHSPTDSMMSYRQQSAILDTSSTTPVMSHWLGNSLSSSSVVTSTSKILSSAGTRLLFANTVTTPSQQGSTSYQEIYSTQTISRNILCDPVKVLYLFQCFQEAQDDELCDILSKSFDGGKINLFPNRLLPHQVVSLGFFLSRSHRKWKELDLSGCGIGDHGIMLLHHYICKDTKSKQAIAIGKVNIGNNSFTQASSPLIVDIITHLQPHTLILGGNNITSVRDISTAVINTNTVKVLHMGDNGLTAQEASAISDMMTCLEKLYISFNKLSDDGATIISEGITITNTLRLLDIRYNNISSTGTTTIANKLLHNTSLKGLHMTISKDGATPFAQALADNKTLKNLSLSIDHKDSKTVMDEESTMIVIRSLHHNSITNLSLPSQLEYKLISNVKREVELINSARRKCNAQELKVNFLG